MVVASLEKAFEYIEKGNGLEEREEFWKASECFSNAYKLLKELASTTPTENEEEGKRIQELCRTQAVEYFEKARCNFLRAIEQENKSEYADAQNQLKGEEAQRRNDVFSNLYSKPIETQERAPTQNRNMSLEDRLAKLNQSLPPSMQTSQERMNSIHRGLGRLGVSLPDNSFSASATAVEPPLSEEEEIDQIIQQAREQVQFSQNYPKLETSHSSIPTSSGNCQLNAATTSDEIAGSVASSEHDSPSASSNEEEVELDTEDIESIKDYVAEAQAQLSELLALLQIDEDQDAEIEFSQPRGKHLLKSALLSLKNARQRWTSCGKSS